MWLRNAVQMKIFSFNGAKFDMRVMAEWFFSIKTVGGVKVECLKRGACYFSYGWKSSNSTISFADILNYTAPCSLSSFLKMAGVEETKSCFPYQKYHSIAELEAATEFPDYDDFWSDLKQEPSCSLSEYAVAKSEFDRRLILSDDDPEKMSNMICWLKYYNNLDVSPFSKAIKVIHLYDNYIKAVVVDKSNRSILKL